MVYFFFFYPLEHSKWLTRQTLSADLLNVGSLFIKTLIFRHLEQVFKGFRLIEFVGTPQIGLLAFVVGRFVELRQKI